jgi:hypothetical protein
MDACNAQLSSWSLSKGRHAGGVSGRPAEQPRGAILERLLPLPTVEGTSISRKAARFAVRRRMGDLRPVRYFVVSSSLAREGQAGDTGARNTLRRGTTSVIAMR